MPWSAAGVLPAAGAGRTDDAGFGLPGFLLVGTGVGPMSVAIDVVGSHGAHRHRPGRPWRKTRRFPR